MRLSLQAFHGPQLPRRIVLAVFFCGQCIQGGGRLTGSDLTYEQVVESRSDQSEFFGVRISYECSYTKVPKSWVFERYPEVIQPGIRTLEIGLPIEGTVAVPFRFSNDLHITNEPLIEGEWVRSYWEAFDGVESRQFIRTLFHDKCAVRHEHVGYVELGVSVRMAHYDPLFTTLFFSSSTSNRLFGEAATEFDPSDLPVGDLEAVGEDRLRVSAMGNWHILTPPPSCFIVDCSPSLPDQFSIGKLRDFNGIVLPEFGSYTHSQWAGDFKVISAERLASNPSNWFPEWPSGTTVVDVVNNEIVSHPFSSEEVRVITDVTNRNCVKNPVAAKGRWRTVFFVCNIVLAFLFIARVLFRKFGADAGCR